MRHPHGRHWTNAEARDALARYEQDIERIGHGFAGLVRRSPAMDLDDLRAEGRIAVLDALASYQGYGVSERTWVNRRVRARMIDALRRLDIRSRHEVRTIRRLHEGSSETESEREKARGAAARRLVSLDGASSDGQALSERIGDERQTLPDEAAHASRQIRMLLRAMSMLNARQRRVLESRLLEGSTLRDTGAELAVSEARAHQIQSLAIERVSAIIRDGSLRSPAHSAGLGYPRLRASGSAA